MHQGRATERQLPQLLARLDGNETEENKRHIVRAVVGNIGGLEAETKLLELLVHEGAQPRRYRPYPRQAGYAASWLHAQGLDRSRIRMGPSERPFRDSAGWPRMHVPASELGRSKGVDYLNGSGEA